MCLATAYVVGGDGKSILEEVSFMQFDGDRVHLVSFSGEKKTVVGRIVEVDFFAETFLLEGCETSASDSAANNPQTNGEPC